MLEKTEIKENYKLFGKYFYVSTQKYKNDLYSIYSTKQSKIIWLTFLWDWVN